VTSEGPALFALPPAAPRSGLDAGSCDEGRQGSGSARPSGPGRRASRGLSLETLVVATFAVFGLRVGLRPISDNSAFVHLRTGIEIARHGHIPRSDIYSFTATGHPWVVQSWLASALYGVAYRLGGWAFGDGGQVHLVVVLQGVLTATLAVLVARLARTGMATHTMASAGIAVVLGAIYWSPRPLIIGLLGLALLITIVEAEANPLWIVPVTWVWVNAHGSFPLGALWLVAGLVGRALDTRRLPRRHLVYLGAEVGGLVLAAVNPLGPRLLSFPLTVGDKAAVFKSIIEWRSPNFQTTDGIFALALLVAGLLIVSRARLAWADTLPAVGFVALALLSLRNVAPAAVVLAPVLGHGLRHVIEAGEQPAAHARPPTDVARRRLNTAVAGGLGAVSVVFALGSLRGSGIDLSTYPTKAEAWMAANGRLDPSTHRVAEQDVVGCYLVLLRGTAGRVFIDDRVDMYPVEVSNDYDTLLHAQPSAPGVLSRYKVDTVLWERRLGLQDVLLAHGWSTSYEDRSWVVLTRP